MNPKVKVCLSPKLFPLYEDRKSIVVVVDVLRATSAMCVAFKQGIRSIIPVSTIEEALDYKNKDNTILAAERNGKVVSGFDLGNSPTDFLKHDLRDKHMVVTTTNGTSAINIAKKDHDVVIGSFLNIGTLANYLNDQARDVIILCAGWKGDFCFEDTLFAGALSKLLIEEGGFIAPFDTTQSSMLMYEQAKDDLFKFLENSQHRNRLAHLNILDDVRYCLRQNTTRIIPKAIGNELVAIS